MTLNRSKQDNVEQRREMVSQLRLRMLSMREICVALERSGIISPITGRAYDVATIKRDIDALKEEWRESRNVNTDIHVDRQFAEMQEIKRAGWAAKDPELALKALDKEMKLLGTAKDKDGLTININMQIVSQLVQAIEARGESASEYFEETLREFQLADSAGNSTAG